MTRAAWASWFLTSAALAQTGLVPQPGLPGLKRVESGISDANPLAVSQRLIPVDLRVPTGFEGVYQFDRSAGWGKTETMYVRMSGGVAAVFPRSVYVPGSGGLVPEIPAGTTFMIGAPKIAAAPTRPVPTSPTAVDLTYRPEVDDRTVAPAVSRESAPQTIWTSEYLRRSRVETLLELARDHPAR